MIDLGYFGNIWVKQNRLLKNNHNGGGHAHKFDHVTLLCQGKVKVEIEGYESKEFTAPTFIIIKKEHQHKITALVDNTIYYCIFALRGIDGEVVDDIYGAQHDPTCTAGVDPDYWEKVKQIKDI
jgi:hypothetical protein